MNMHASNVEAALRYKARDFIQNHRTLAVEISRQLAQVDGSPSRPLAPRAALTPRQKELLDFIRRYTEEQGGISPSYEEMATYVGLQSKSGIHRVVIALEERGFIRRLENRARSIVVVGADEREAA